LLLDGIDGCSPASDGSDGRGQLASAADARAHLAPQNRLTTTSSRAARLTSSSPRASTSPASAHRAPLARVFVDPVAARRGQRAPMARTRLSAWKARLLASPSTVTSTKSYDRMFPSGPSGGTGHRRQAKQARRGCTRAAEQRHRGAARFKGSSEARGRGAGPRKEAASRRPRPGAPRSRLALASASPHVEQGDDSPAAPSRSRRCPAKSQSNFAAKTRTIPRSPRCRKCTLAMRPHPRRRFVPLPVPPDDTFGYRSIGGT
jgi:hypothetical protein